MNKHLIILLPVLSAVLFLACTPSPAPVSEPKTPAAKTAAPLPGAAWERQWADSLAQAKKEGMVSAYAAGWGAPTRTALTQAFKAKYGIDLEFTAFGRGGEMATRVQKEKAAGLNIADVFPTGTGTLLTIMKPIDLLGSIEPFLMLPEVTDPGPWGGTFPFVDKDKTSIAMTASLQRYVIYNTELVKKGEISSFKDLLKPQYKGKITLNDPTLTGPGNGMMTHLAINIWNLEEAKDFLRQLIVQQELAIQRDNRLHVESVARGKFAIAVAPWPDILTDFVKAGAPLGVAILKEGPKVGAAAGAIGVPVTPAHPNATRVFLNWLLTREGQTILAQVYGVPSMRLDVPTEGLNPLLLPQPGEKLYPDTEEFIMFQGKMATIAAEVIQQASGR